MDHIDMYGRLRASVLARRFCFNGDFRANIPSESARLDGVTSRAEYDALPATRRAEVRASGQSRGGENPWALAGGSLATALAVESHFGHAHARAALGSLLESAQAQFAFSGPWAGYPVRWDPLGTPPDRWRRDANGAPMYAAEFPITSGRYDFANAPREFRRFPRREPGTYNRLLGPFAPPPADDPNWGDCTYHRRWEMSQDEVFGLLTGMYAIHQFGGDAALQSQSASIIGRLANYLSFTGYLLVKPEGGIVGRGAGDSLVGSEYALGRAFNTVLGQSFASQRDWAGAMSLAGHWDQLAGPITGFTVLGGLASVVANLLALAPPGGLATTLLAALTTGQAALGNVCPDLANASRDFFLLAKLSKMLAVTVHGDVFDPYREPYRGEHAMSIFLYEYDRATRYRIYSQLCGVLPGSGAPVNFMGQTGLMLVNDSDVMARSEWLRWLNLRMLPLGATPRGLPSEHPMFTMGVACLMGATAFEPMLMQALDAAKSNFEGAHEADLQLVEVFDDNNSLVGLAEVTASALDYMAGLALAWLHARRQSDAGIALTPGFPQPPIDFSVLPRPRAPDGTDLFPLDRPAPRSPTPPVRVPAAPGTQATPVADRSFTVSAADAEVDTGITIHYGDVFRITASGSINPGGLHGFNGPNGVPGPNQDARWPLHSGIDPTNTPYSLLARLNGWFEVGTDSGERRWLYDCLDDQADAARRLFLRINDDVSGDGSGAFQVRVRVWGMPKLHFDRLQANGFAWFFPPSIRFALRCDERASSPVCTISVKMPDGSFAPIVGETLGVPQPLSELLEGDIRNHPAVLSPPGQTTVFWLGRLVGGGSLYGRNDSFTFRLEARTAEGYFAVAECTASIVWHGERIECIRRPPAHRPVRVLGVGGSLANGRQWQLSAAEAIAEIERGQAFYVERPVGDRVKVIVSHTHAGRKYIKTEADGDQPNNLLALPECPR